MSQYAWIVHKHIAWLFIIFLIMYDFSQDHEGCLIKQRGVLSVSDPFLLSDWLEYSKQKLLTLVQEDISTTLHNILQHDDPKSICEDNNEETFIQVQLDVIQVPDK